MLHLNAEGPGWQQVPEPSLQLYRGDELRMDLKSDRLGVLYHGNRRWRRVLVWNLVGVSLGLTADGGFLPRMKLGLLFVEHV